MFDLTIGAALAASCIWAIGGLLAFGPARAMGVFHFVRLQIYSATIAASMICYGFGWYQTLDFRHAIPVVISGLFGILLTNFTLISTIRNGGPRRAEILRTSSFVFTAIFGYFYFSEVMALDAIFACLLIFVGIIIAVLSNGPNQGFEAVQGKIQYVIIIGLLCGLFHSIGLLAMKGPLAEGVHPFEATASRLWVASLLLLPTHFMRHKAENRPRISLRLAVQAMIPGFLGYIVASSLLFYALDGRNSAEVVILGSLAPIFILPIQWIITRQRLGTGAYIGSLFAVVGIYFLLST